MTDELDFFKDTPHGQAAIKKLKVVPEGFRFYLMERLGRAPDFSDVVKLRGATYRKADKGANKGKLTVRVKGSDVDVYVTDAEAITEKEVKKQPWPNHNWCVGCTPDDCSGCGTEPKERRKIPENERDSFEAAYRAARPWQGKNSDYYLRKNPLTKDEPYVELDVQLAWSLWQIRALGGKP